LGPGEGDGWTVAAARKPGDMGALPPPGGRRWGRLRRIGAQLPRYLDYTRRDPGWPLMFSLGRLMPVRRAVWRLSRPYLPEPRPSPLFPQVSAKAVAEALRRDGVHPGLLLPEPVVRGIRGFAERTPCFGNIDGRLEFLARDQPAFEQALGRAVLVGHFLDRIEACPEVQAVRQDPLLYDIACRYLRARAVPIGSRLWWSFPTRQACDDGVLIRAAQDNFHFDLDDWRTLKFFFYLTPVGEENGPHLYVRESHRLRALRHQFTVLKSQDAEAIRGYYGAARILRVEGPAGFGFAADPFGYHTGTTVQGAPRLMLDVEFGVSRGRSHLRSAIGDW
jgi:hypothetical protein